MEIYFNDCIQVNEESTNLTAIENEMIGNISFAVSVKNTNIFNYLKMFLISSFLFNYLIFHDLNDKSFNSLTMFFYDWNIYWNAYSFFLTDVNKENFSWNNQNTKLLIHLYEERKEKFRDPKVKKKFLWAEIAKEFKKQNYTCVTEDILDRKMRNMKKTYRTIKDNQKLSGRGRITWEYFETFENIFLDDKTMNIESTLSSMQSQPVRKYIHKYKRDF